MIEDIKKFLGISPYNTDSNIVRSDPFYLKFLYSKYGEETVKAKIKELGKDKGIGYDSRTNCG